MRYPVFFLTFLFFFSICKNNFAQGEADVPFLLLQPSPSLAAMGQTGTALPTNDPFGFIWNPAQLGYSSRTTNLSYIFYPSKIDWLGGIIPGVEFKAMAFNAGYNLKDVINFPLNVGFGYSRNEFNHRGFFQSDGSKDYYDAYSLGFGIDYFVQFNAGFTVKNITSKLVDYIYGEEQTSAEARRTVTDFGLLINVPVIKLIEPGLHIGSDANNRLIPFFNFSTGYSKSNIGDKIYYVYPAQAGPLPRTDRLGYGINTGLDYKSGDFLINYFTLSFTAEADDILVSWDNSTVQWSYQSTFSDLRLWKNLINIEGDENIVSHTGVKLDLFETISLSAGHFSGRGYWDVRKTNGYELRTKGLFKLYARWAKDPITDFLRDHIDIVYYYTAFFAGHPFETKMSGLAFYFSNIESLF